MAVLSLTSCNLASALRQLVDHAHLWLCTRFGCGQVLRAEVTTRSDGVVVGGDCRRLLCMLRVVLGRVPQLRATCLLTLIFALRAHT